MATSIRFTIQDRVEAEQPEKPQPQPLVAFEQQSKSRTDVPDDLTLSDPVVLRTQRLLNKGKRDTGGLIPAPAVGLHIHKSRVLHDRALRIMQALLMAFEKRGFPVSTTTDGIRVTILESPGLAFRAGIHPLAALELPRRVDSEASL